MDNENRYDLTEPSPVKKGDVVKVDDDFYLIKKLEPLYYKYQNLSGGVDQGFASSVYSITDLIPSPNFLYYITGIGFNGDFEAQLKFQSGHARNAPNSKSTHRLTQLHAHYLKPFSFKFCLKASDTLDLDINISNSFSGVKGEVWFYGWKYEVKLVHNVVNFIELEDA